MRYKFYKVNKDLRQGKKAEKALNSVTFKSCLGYLGKWNK